jgi:DNA topoisomerase-1
MATTLVIVESPAKAKTIQRFLDESDALEGDVVVEASVGHIRDLPARAADVPEAYKQQWEILGIEVDNDFKPLYVISPDKRDRIRDLKRLMKDATELYLATDEDREGEAISWHLLEVLNPPDSMPVKRMVFHEITPQAIREAMENPREIDRRLVDAQEARRLLDRIYGYGPLASAARQKVGQGTTVGRVQSVATRLVVERERERMAFVSAGYWDLDGEFTATGGASADEARTF